MKHLHFLAFALCWLVWGHLLKAQSIDHYSSLDPSQPIEFKGNCLRYADKEIILGPKTFFVDGQLSDREVADNPYVFNSFNKAAANFSAGTEAEPMKVYLAPSFIGLMIRMTLLFVLVKTDVNRSAWLLNALISILSD